MVGDSQKAPLPAVPAGIGVLEKRQESMRAPGNMLDDNATQRAVCGDALRKAKFALERGVGPALS
jgi:hypothetical protein